MSKSLWMTMLAAHFARGSRRPHIIAPARILMAVSSSLIIGSVLGRSLTRAGLPIGLPQAWMDALITLTGYTLVGLVLWSLSAIRGQTHSFDRLVSTLPVSRSTRWILRTSPPAIVTAIMLSFATPLVRELAHSLQLPVLPMLLHLTAGAIAALGLTLATAPRSTLARAGIFVSVIVGGIMLLQHSWPTWLYVIISTTYLGFWQSFRDIRTPAIPYTRDRQLLRLPADSLHAWWFVLKLLRNRRSILALAFSTALAIIAAVSIQLRHLAPVGGSGWLLLGAILTTAIACDIRGLSPRHKAPEVEALGGPKYFVRSQVSSALVALAPSLPIFIVLAVAQVEPIARLGFFYIGLQVAALLIGLLASSIFVPRDGDTGAQFFAAALATSALLAMPKLAHFQDDTLTQQSAIWLTLAALAYLLIHMIENQRRNRLVAI